MDYQTPQNTTPGKKAKQEVLSINYFYDLFIKKSIRNKKITFAQYKKIIYNFLKIYFFELYIGKAPMYFFFGGMMKVVSYEPWTAYQYNGGFKKKKLTSTERSMGLFWYLRPSKKMYYMAKIKKLNGSTNMLPKIESVFSKNNDKDLLPIFTKEKKKGKLYKTLYKCIPN